MLLFFLVFFIIIVLNLSFRINFVIIRGWIIVGLYFIFVLLVIRVISIEYIFGNIGKKNKVGYRFYKKKNNVKIIFYIFYLIVKV